MTPAFGAFLGFSFGLGRSLPFLFAALAVSPFSRASCRMGKNRWMRYAGASVLFLVAGYYLYLSKPFL
jgi:cytochrome c-type biogenesis protein